MATLKSITVVIGIVKNEAGEIFITRRHDTLHLGGLWEFAGGKVEAGEMLHTALARELKEEMGIEIIDAIPLIRLRHTYLDCMVQMHVFEVTKYTGIAQSRLGQNWVWVKLADLKNYTFPAANRAILHALRLPPYYAILDDESGDLLAKLNHLLAQNITLIQARLKRSTAVDVRAFLEMAYPLCVARGALLLLNSGTEKAFEMPCDGVHLTSCDLLALGERPANLDWLSASCHSPAELKHAEKIGVDFAVLSPVLATQSHPDVEPLRWEIFVEWVAECNVPVYALGGVTKSDLETARFYGGQGIAAIRTFLEV